MVVVVVEGMEYDDGLQELEEVEEVEDQVEMDGIQGE